MGMPEMKAQHITLVLDGAEPHFEIQLLEFDPTPGRDADPASTRRTCGVSATTTSRSASTTSKQATAHLVANGVAMLSDEMDYISRELRLFEGPQGDHARARRMGRRRLTRNRAELRHTGGSS